MKIALLTDTHYEIRSSQTILKATNDFLNKVFYPYLIEHDIKQIVHLGDLFDKRRAIDTYYAASMRENFVQPAINNRIKIDIILGNHDVYFKNTNTVNSVEMMIPNGVEIHREPTTKRFGDTEIFLCPWINAENKSDTITAIKKSTAQVLFGHLELVGFKFDKTNIAEHGMNSELFENFDVVCSGHYHHKSSKGNIHYLGSHMQFTWADYDDPRGFHIFDTDTRELEFIENPNRLFHKLTYENGELMVDGDVDSLDGAFVKIIIDDRTNEEQFNNMLDGLKRFGFSDVKFIDQTQEQMLIGDDEDLILDSTEDSKSIMTRYIDEVDMAVNKDHLKKTMLQLYDLAMETV